ncbi:MAG: ATP phosphoribosyltransferase [Pseudomonadota bacterium]
MNPLLEKFNGLTIALSKGRILDETLPLLAAAGIVPTIDPHKSRKLILPTQSPNVRLLILRATDVPTFVEQGAADIGIAGRDVLIEAGSKSLYEILDLHIARCRLMVAYPESFSEDVSSTLKPLKVATKFERITRHYFAERGRQVQVVKLYGSMELAPLVGLADCIVDVVDTGKTLAAHGLRPTELIMDVSSRLIVNPGILRMKWRQINPIVEAMRHAVKLRKNELSKRENHVDTAS